MAVYRTDSEVPAEWQVGDVLLDKYEVREILGRGGFGIVYKVYHRSFDIELAVKSPLLKRLEGKNGREDFVREASNWVQLGLHPHVVTCHYVRTIGGVARVFAEYVAGGSLHDWIESRKLYEGGHEVALERMLDIAIQMAWGLHYAHQRGLVHQDMKPHNVMMTPDGVAKVSDFGLAKARDLVTISQQVTVMGRTLAYCSPEQGMSGMSQKVTRKADIWSWGLSILQMFMGEVTWLMGALAPMVLEMYLQQGARAPDAAIFPPMPPAIADLLRNCFQQVPTSRPATMANIADTLLAIFQKEMGYNYLHFRRPAEAVSDSLADNLNNRAVSLMELGKVQEAEQLWQKALQLCPQHIEAIANLEVSHWRRGQQDDIELVLRLLNVCNSFDEQWLPKYLLALVHLERADIDAAIKLLDAASQQAPNNPDIQATLALAHSGTLRHVRLLKTLTGHTCWVNSVAFSPDGKLALSGSVDKTLKVWQVKSGQLLHTLIGHTSYVNSVAFSPDGKDALSGSSDKTLNLWEIKSGELLHTVTGHTSHVQSVAFSPDGKLALSGSYDQTLNVWQVKSWQLLHPITGHTSKVNSVAFSPDGKLALSDFYTRLKVWQVESGQLLKTLTGHTSSVSSVAFSPDGKLALSGSSDKTLKVWQLESGQLLKTLTGHRSSVSSVAFSSDGKLALSGSGDRTLKVWQLESGRCLRTLTRHTFWVNSVAFSPDGKLALSGSYDKTLKVWQIENGPWQKQYAYWLAPLWSHGAWAEVQREVQHLQQEAQQNLSHKAFGMAHMLLRKARQRLGPQPTNRLLASWQALYPLSKKISLQSTWLIRTLTEHTDRVRSVAFSPDGRLALSNSTDKTLKLWQVESGQVLKTLRGHTDLVNSVAFSPDDRLALSGSLDNTLKVWQVESGQLLHTLIGHTSYVNSVAFSPDGKLALSGSGNYYGNNKTLKVWLVESGQLLHTLIGHTSYVNSVAFSPDGKLALSGCHDKTLKVWEVQSGRCLRTLTGHTSSVNSVAFSPDGKLALSGSSDKTLKVWQVASGQLLHSLKGHKSSVNSVAFSPDGKYALSGSDDKTLKVWQIESGRCLRTLTGHTKSVTSVAFSPDSRYALSGSDDGTIKVWGLDWQLEARELADWDEGARHYLQNFLTRQVPLPYVGSLPTDIEPTEEEIRLALTRRGKPTWTEEEFTRLMRELGNAGYGWLRADGVRARLVRMARRM